MNIYCKPFKNINNNNNFVEVVYNNFIYLEKFPELQHTKQEIKKLLTNNSNNNNFLFFHNNVCIGYLIGEYKNLDDNRYVYYISYLYLLQKYRNHGIGKIIMNFIIDKCRTNNIEHILLTCDSLDEKVFNFYKKLGFDIDKLYNNNNRHKVLCLNITK